MRLIESSAPRRRNRAGTLLSVAAHAAVIVAAVTATADAGIRAADVVPETTIHYAPPPPAAPTPPAPAPRDPAPAGPVPSEPGVAVPSAPMITPIELPP